MIPLNMANMNKDLNMFENLARPSPSYRRRTFKLPASKDSRRNSILFADLKNLHCLDYGARLDCSL